MPNALRVVSLAAPLALVATTPCSVRAGRNPKAQQVKAERAQAARVANKKAVHQAMQEAKGKGTSPCLVLGKETVAAAKDLVLRGVDPGYLQAITTLDTARSVAASPHKAIKGHTLSKAQWSEVAGSTCQTILDDLQTQRKKLEAKAPKANAAPKDCKVLDKKLEHVCYAGLRDGKVSDACQQISSYFGMGGLSHAQACQIAAQMIQ